MTDEVEGGSSDPGKRGHGYEHEWWLQICQRRHLKDGIGQAR